MKIKKTIGFLISKKENENRRALIHLLEKKCSIKCCISSGITMR
jgi:hypothetical protein